MYVFFSPQDYVTLYVFLELLRLLKELSNLLF